MSSRRKDRASGGKTGNGERMIDETGISSMTGVAVMPEGGIETGGGAPFEAMLPQGFSISPGGPGVEGGMGETARPPVEIEMPRGGMDATYHEPSAAAGVAEGAVATRHHVFVLPGREVSRGQAEAEGLAGGAPVGFDFPTVLRGSTTHFHVYYDPGLGAAGQTLADGVLASCESEYNTLVAYFGVTPPSFNVIIAAGIGGAYHYGCGATDLYCDASGTNVDHTRMLNVAEEVEVFSAVQNKGWNCGASNGEGLSRVLATLLYPAQLDGFNSAATWLDTPGRPDFVNVNDPTDRSYVSTGCSVLFLNWLRYQLGYRWESIVQAGGSTLAQTYQRLTGQADGLTPFKALLQAHFPAGTPSHLTNDNPFPFVTAGVWHNWENLGGVLTSGIGASSWGPNRIDCFVKGTDNAMWHKWWDGTAWRGFESLGGVIDGTPAAVSWGPNRIDCFARGMDNAMWHRWWDGAAWRGWENLGGVITSGPAAASWGPNRLDCFVKGTNNAMFHKWWDGSSWSGWENLGGVIDGAPAAVSWGPNRIDCFARGMDNAMYHRWWDGTAWHGWENLGGNITSAPAVASWAPNRLDCFAKGDDNALWHKWWNGSSWSGWESLGGVIDDEPGAVSWAANRIDCFARGMNNAMWHKWWS
jgi:hypothetical protein